MIHKTPKQRAEEAAKRYEQARVKTHDIKIALTLAGAFRINEAGEVVSVHLEGAKFQPVTEGMPEQVVKEITENRYQLCVGLVGQAIENLAMKKLEKQVADELGVPEYARELMAHSIANGKEGLISPETPMLDACMNRCPPGCRGYIIGANGLDGPADWSGCSCGEGKLANGQPQPPGFECDCPNHPKVN